MGRAPRELLLKAVSVLLKLLENVARAPSEVKYRTLRVSNRTINAMLDVPGVLALLGYAGFEQSDSERLSLDTARPLAPLEDALGQMRRMHALLHGLPPPPESLNSLRAGSAAASTAVASSSAADEPSHRCSMCHAGIQNDLRRQMAGNGEIGGWRTHSYIGGGEFRYHCGACNRDLCAKCYDKWKAGDDSVHPPEHAGSIEIIAPITTPWGSNGYGVPPAPPPVTSRNRRGPWG
jgi:hypothetical protein